MKFNVIGIGDYKGKCVYDEAEDALMLEDEVVVDFKKKYKDYHRYTKFLINSPLGRRWISFQFIPAKKAVLAKPFAIITAHNPKDMIFNSFLNFIRNTELESVIKSLGYDYMTSIGELYEYREESFIVYDIELKEALRIASMFDQDTIFYNDTKEISIIKCENAEKILNYNYEIHFKGE
jgi:hypothetical protein